MSEVDANEAACDASEPVRVARLGAGIGDYIRYARVGQRMYLNIYDIVDGDHLRPGIGSLVGGQTWVTGLCGEDAVLVGEGVDPFVDEPGGALTPVFYGEDGTDVDPTLACSERGGDRNRIYRVDLSGGSRPEFLLEGWGCDIDVARMVTAYRDGDVHELWRVPNFPDLDGAVRLAADIAEEVGLDAAHNYYLDPAQALHAVDIHTGADEVLLTGVLKAKGANYLPAWTEPARLLMLAKVPGEAEGVYLYRGETGEVVRLADVQPADLPEPPQNGWAWDFNDVRTFIYYRPFGGAQPDVRVFDLDGAPLVFPGGVRAERVSATGVLGSAPGPQGSQWVFAWPGVAEATVLDMPWDPGLEIPIVGSEDVYWFQGGRLYRTPLDGGPRVEVLDYGYRYSDDDALMQHGDQLLHADRDTNATTVLVDGVGAYAPVVYRDGGEFVSQGVFYTDISDPKKPELWFMPTAWLPGAP